MTLFTLSPDLVRGLACAVWLAVLIALVVRRPAWRFAPAGVRLMLAGLAIVGAGLLIGAVFTILHRVSASPDRIAAEAISLIAGLFALAGVLRFRPVVSAPSPDMFTGADITEQPLDLAEPAPEVRSADARAASEPDEPEPAWRVNALQKYQSDKQEAMTRLAGGLAHDFSNVLTVILTASEILLLEQNLPEKVRRRIERMNGAAQRGAALADQLRSFAGHQDLQSEVIDLHDLLRSDAVRLKAAVGPDIELHYEFADDPCPVLIDPEQMCAAVATVLVYCRSTLPNGGRVSLSTRFETVPVADAAPDGLAGGVVLTIARSGQRLSMEQAHRLLDEPYSIGTSSVVGGGFGLSLVAGFIRQSGGEAEFVEEPGRGPVLEIRLPLVLDGVASGTFGAEADLEGAEVFSSVGTHLLAEPAPPVTPPSVTPSPAMASVVPHPAAPVPQVEPLHVLVVEEDELLRESVMAELASLGCSVSVAATPAEGFARLERVPSINVLLSGLSPGDGEDGVELARQVKAWLPHLRVVLMSADITRTGTLENGLAVLLPKPFTRAQLADSLRLER